MFSGHAQRGRSGAERFCGAEVEKSEGGGGQQARRWTRGTGGGDGPGAVAVGGLCIGIMLVLVGAPVTGLVVGGVPALAWLLWRCWRPLGKACETACLPMLGRPEGAGGTGDERAEDGFRSRPRRGGVDEPGPESCQQRGDSPVDATAVMT